MGVRDWHGECLFKKVTTMVHDRLRDQIESIRKSIGDGHGFHSGRTLCHVIDYREAWLTKYSAASKPTAFERLVLGCFVELLCDASPSEFSGFSKKEHTF